MKEKEKEILELIKLNNEKTQVLTLFRIISNK
jgi:hypothetical protein